MAIRLDDWPAGSQQLAGYAVWSTQMMQCYGRLTITAYRNRRYPYRASKDASLRYGVLVLRQQAR